MVNGRSMDRLAQRVASVMSVRLDRRRAQMARLHSAAMILARIEFRDDLGFVFLV